MAFFIFLVIDFALFCATPSEFYPSSRLYRNLPGSGVYVFARAVLRRGNAP